MGPHQLPHLQRSFSPGGSGGSRAPRRRGWVSARLAQPLPPDTHAGLQGAPSLLSPPGSAEQQPALPAAAFLLVFCESHRWCHLSASPELGDGFNESLFSSAKKNLKEA